MTLQQLKMNRKARIVGFERLGVRESLRLDGLGLRVGAPIQKLLRTPLRDPVECLLGHQLVTIDAQLLACVQVEPEP